MRKEELEHHWSLVIWTLTLKIQDLVMNPGTSSRQVPGVQTPPLVLHRPSLKTEGNPKSIEQDFLRLHELISGEETRA